jgi:Cellulose binding domain
VGQTGPDRAQLPSWPPLSPAVAAATDTADPPPPANPPPSDPPDSAVPPESAVADGAPGVLPDLPPARAPRSRLRFVAIGVVTVLLVVTAVLLITPAHRPGRTATIAPPAAVPAPAPGGTVGAAQSAPVGGPGASGRPAAAGTTAAPRTQPGGPTPASPGAPSTGSGAPPPAPGAVSATWLVTVHTGPDAGYRTDVVLTNHGDAAVTGWQLVFTLSPGETVAKADGAVYVQAGALVTLTPKDPNQILHPGQKIAVRFEVKGSTAPPSGCTVNGSPCG